MRLHHDLPSRPHMPFNPTETNAVGIAATLSYDGEWLFEKT